MNKPKSRNENIVVQEMNKELLIYDLNINKAFCLNETSKIIWELSDGTRSISAIAANLQSKLKQNINEEFVLLALKLMRKDDLLETDFSFSTAFNSLSRRQMVKKVGLATMAALPLVISVTAPKAAQAASDLCAGKICNDNNRCTIDSCDPQTGNCIFVQRNCNDNNPCTVDSCDPQTGCVNTPIICPQGQACNRVTGICA